MKTAYTFACLRYRHDPVSGEFLNLGLVMAGKDGRFRWKIEDSPARFAAAFPGLDESAFSSMCESVRASLEIARERLDGTDMPDALECAYSVMPPGDGILVWSNVMCGIGDDLGAVFDRNYERFVSRYRPAA